jgi:2Fe-2S ferredoxin
MDADRLPAIPDLGGLDTLRSQSSMQSTLATSVGRFRTRPTSWPLLRYTGVLPKVTFLPANETFEFESGKLPYKSHGKPESLLDVAMNFGFHLEHACGGSCACTTCHVVVKKGVDNLSPMDDDEFDRVEQASDFQLNSRLGCQAIVKGDVTVHIPAWNRNYVSEGH